MTDTDFCIAAKILRCCGLYRAAQYLRRLGVSWQGRRFLLTSAQSPLNDHQL